MAIKEKYLDKTGVEKLWDKVLAKQEETLQASKNHADANKISSENKLTADIQAVNQALTDFKSLKGVANGLATLNSEGHIPASNLPSYVDDIIEGKYYDQITFKDLNGNIITGETGKVYVSTDTNRTYRWTGQTYIQIKGDITLGETSSTAYAGDKGKANAKAIAQLTTNLGNLQNEVEDNYLKSSTASSTYQTKLVSGTTIKTVNGQSILGSGNIAIQVDNIDMSGYYTKTETNDLVKNMAEWYVTPSTTSTGIVVASNGKVHASPLSIVDNFNDSASNGVPTTDAVTTYLEANYHPLMTPLTSEEIDAICI